ncbi:transcription factor FapR [Allobacillus halotolerans]|uniref:Transcription factor FapR n=1 Tax=Allobacillus halotolerans TaxID=570278 RepID=A0ABS6GQF7_9BACI|nr:transcription factor FapR [Allobacillus halotolerans]MBU6081332.1 transcription factor FapR [Allobacillus halotolerans]
MKLKKKDRQEQLNQAIEQTPFITDEELAEQFQVSIQTIRLDRMELGIPEVRKRIESVAQENWDETLKALPADEVIGEVIDLELDQSAISILDIQAEHVFSRNHIARGHHLFAQANSLCVAVIDDELALTVNASIQFKRSVRLNERVVAKAKVIHTDKKRTTVEVNSHVEKELVFSGTFEMYRSTD